MTKKLNIVMAGGGSGGHVFPIKSLVEYLVTKPEYLGKVNNVYRFGEVKGLEHKIYLSMKVQTKLRFTFVSILSGKFRRETKRKSRLKNVRDIFIFLFGIFQSIYYLLSKKIDVIFCKGGYVALPVVVAGFILRKKIIIHESDVRAGLVNRIANKFSTKSFTGFDNVFSKAETVGQIISDDIIISPADITHKNSTNLFSNDFISILESAKLSQKTIVLVTGGSLGSKSLYTAFHNVIASDRELANNYIFFVVGGVLNSEIKEIFSGFDNVHTFDFVTQKQMGLLYSYSDIGLCRAGTTSLAEQKLYDMKLLIVPIPRTHDQYDNTKFYVKHYKDILIDQKIDFEKTLLSSLKANINFKKHPSNKNKLKEIAIAKDIIIKNILL